MRRCALAPSASRLRSLALLTSTLVWALACLHQESSDPPPTALAGSSGSEATPQTQTGGSATRSAPAHHIRRGRRGTGCSVKNDCAQGLSCIQGVCQPSSFGLEPSGKECVQIDCASSADCCGNLSSEIPAKCRSRGSVCLQQLPGCVVKQCTRSGECGGGGVCVGKCVVTSGECRGNVDCLANKCLEGKCSLDFGACASDADCAPNNCAGGSCSCLNPGYTPADPVCSDEDCDGLCLWACEESRCVLPSTCETNSDCVGARPLCVDGSCVECSASTDCSFDKICLDGSCETRCQNDSQCALFEACQAGECLYVGCRSDRECTLIPDPRTLGFSAGIDTRLLRCNTEKGVGRCVVPCQTDSQCKPTEVCSGGLCQYIGCETSQECATILGVHGQVTSDAQPWVPSVECRADEP